MARSGNTLLGSLAAQLPFSTFLKLLDLKLGSEIVTYFVIFNKVAGLYGLLAVFYGGTFAQVALYLYSIASLLACAWGLRQIGEVGSASLHTQHACCACLWPALRAADASPCPVRLICIPATGKRAKDAALRAPLPL